MMWALFAKSQDRPRIPYKKNGFKTTQKKGVNKKPRATGRHEWLSD
jgi:hypothetical protein